MEYRPRSFQEHIQEIIGNQIKKGYWMCLNCKALINREKLPRNNKKKMINESRIQGL